MLKAANNAYSELGQAINASVTSFSVVDGSSFPDGNFVVTIDDEIMLVGNRTGDSFSNVQRGYENTNAAAHDAGAPVRGMLRQWGFFLPQPDSDLADQLTTNFAARVNELGLDMAYFDASEGANAPYIDQWYQLNKLHTGYYTKFDHDVFYQTSTGTGSNLLWHIVPRSASADGHGDIKGYLDNRWPGILNQARNWTRSDIGWYYMFTNVRPDQIGACARGAQPRPQSPSRRRASLDAAARAQDFRHARATSGRGVWLPARGGRRADAHAQ